MKLAKLFLLLLIFALLLSLAGCSRAPDEEISDPEEEISDPDPEEGNAESGHEHSYGDWDMTYAPTSCESGWVFSYCTCGESKGKFIYPTEQHVYEEWQEIIPATCSSNGSRYAYCVNCETRFTETIPFVPHDYVDGVCTMCAFQRGNAELSYYYSSWNDYYIVNSVNTATGSDVVIPDTLNGVPVVEISFHSQNFSKMTSLSIGANVKYISLYAVGFEEEGTDYYDIDLSRLESITVSENNARLRVEGNCLIDNETQRLLLGCKNSVIPQSVASIGVSAFSGCSSLTALHIPSSVKEIGVYAFRNCTGLTELVIPSSVERIENYALNGCNNLETLTVPFLGFRLDYNLGGHLGYIFGGSSFNAPSDSVPTSLKTVIVTNEDAVESYAFCGTGITNIVLPDCFERIKAYAFFGCSSLKELVIPSSVTKIGMHAFRGCTAFDTVYYCGTREEWEQVFIGSYNDVLTSATCYFYSETAPTRAGNYWHYVNGVPTKW